MAKHPIAQYSFEEIMAMMLILVSLGLIKAVKYESAPGKFFTIYNYISLVKTDWVKYPMMLFARGLVLDTELKQIVALPFAKFFNYFEKLGKLVISCITPENPIVKVEYKIDGSLGILYYDYYQEKWCMNTRGSYNSPQATWGLKHFMTLINHESLDKKVTYLFEIVCEESRVVIFYETDHLKLLSAYHIETCEEMSREQLEETATKLGTPIVEQYDISSFNTIGDIERLVFLMKGHLQEGVVVTLADGQKFKFKSTEYIKLHRAQDGQLTKLKVLNLIKYSLNPREKGETFADGKPEEHYKGIMEWVNEIVTKYDSLKAQLEADFTYTKDWIPKDIGQRKHSTETYVFKLPKNLNSLIFAKRKGQTDNIEKILWGNVQKSLKIK